MGTKKRIKAAFRSYAKADAVRRMRAEEHEAAKKREEDAQIALVGATSDRARCLNELLAMIDERNQQKGYLNV